MKRKISLLVGILMMFCIVVGNQSFAGCYELGDLANVDIIDHRILDYKCIYKRKNTGNVDSPYLTEEEYNALCNKGKKQILQNNFEKNNELGFFVNKTESGGQEYKECEHNKEIKISEKKLYHNPNDVDSEWLTKAEYDTLKARLENCVENTKEQSAQEELNRLIANFNGQTEHPLLSSHPMFNNDIKIGLNSSKYRWMFMMKNGFIYLAKIEKDKVDLYKESDVKYSEADANEDMFENEVSEYARPTIIYPVYKDGIKDGGYEELESKCLPTNGPAKDITMVDTARYVDINQEMYSKENKVFSFLVCKEHTRCKSEKGCENLVGVVSDFRLLEMDKTKDLENYIDSVMINSLCKNHSCFFFWETFNAHNRLSRGNILSAITYANESVDNYGRPKIQTKEGVLCIDEERAYDKKGPGLADKSVIHQSYFCKEHTCATAAKDDSGNPIEDKCCINPVIGVHLNDGLEKEPTNESIYQDRNPELYSHFCLHHFCWERMCRDNRNNSGSFGPQSPTDEVIIKDFAEYCSEHNHDCTKFGCKGDVKRADYQSNGGKYLCEAHKDLEIKLVQCSLCGRMVQEEFCAKTSKGNYVCDACIKTAVYEGKEELYIPSDKDETVSVGELQAQIKKEEYENSCHHDAPIGTDYRFEQGSSPDTHKQIWTCANCGQQVEKEFPHEYDENGVCVCQKPRYDQESGNGPSGNFPGPNGSNPGWGGNGDQFNNDDFNGQFEPPVEENTCTHDYLAREIYISDVSSREHSKRWKCPNCGEEITENVPHRFVNGVCVCGRENEEYKDTYPVYEGKRDTYKVEFDANGGEGEMLPEEFLPFELQRIAKNEFTKEGAKFIGWSSKKNGEVTHKEGEMCIATGNIRLYAVWEQSEFVVTFDANGGEGEMEKQIFEIDEEKELSENKFIKKDYKFIGWSLEKDGKIEYTDKQSIKPEDNMTLYAVWEKALIVKWNDPVLKTGMKPVKYENNEWVEVSEEDWEYDYNTIEDENTGKWANAMTEDGSMFVWIPRYTYKVTYSNNKSENSWNNTSRPGKGKIEIKFSDATKDDTNDGFLHHPAFTFGDKELKGIWVAKYEMSKEKDSDNIVSKPNSNSLTNISASEMYEKSYEMNRELDSHLMKNSEWGAVAYLTNAVGKIPYINNSSDYITGNSGDTQDAKEKEGTVNEYNTTKGVKASTTHNVYGIYDMNGGAQEMVATYYLEGEERYLSDDVHNKEYAGSLYKNRDTKYVDKYEPGVEDMNGDATSEIKINTVTEYSWDGDFAYVLPYKNYPLFVRGGTYDDRSESGIFNYFCSTGAGVQDTGFRTVVVTE